MSKLTLFVHYEDEQVSLLEVSAFAADNIGSVMAGVMGSTNVAGAALVCSRGTVIEELGKSPRYGWAARVASQLNVKEDTI